MAARSTSIWPTNGLSKFMGNSKLLSLSLMCRSLLDHVFQTFDHPIRPIRIQGQLKRVSTKFSKNTTKFTPNNFYKTEKKEEKSKQFTLQSRRVLFFNVYFSSILLATDLVKGPMFFKWSFIKLSIMKIIYPHIQIILIVSKTCKRGQIKKY